VGEAVPTRRRLAPLPGGSPSAASAIPLPRDCVVGEDAGCGVCDPGLSRASPAAAAATAATAA